MKNGILSPGDARESFKYSDGAEHVAYMQQLKLAILFCNYMVSAINVDWFQ